MRVVIWHNVATDDLGRSESMSTGYRPGDPLVPVHAYDVPDVTGAGDVALAHDAADAAFDLFNIGETGEAVPYRARGNRSLSVGDVVQAGDVWLACASQGWKRIEAPTRFALGVHKHGTHSLAATWGDTPGVPSYYPGTLPDTQP